jgi:hypothetical protein
LKRSQVPPMDPRPGHVCGSDWNRGGNKLLRPCEQLARSVISSRVVGGEVWALVAFEEDIAFVGVSTDVVGGGDAAHTRADDHNIEMLGDEAIQARVCDTGATHFARVVQNLWSWNGNVA